MSIAPVMVSGELGRKMVAGRNLSEMMLMILNANGARAFVKFRVYLVNKFRCRCLNESQVVGRRRQVASVFAEGFDDDTRDLLCVARGAAGGARFP